MNFGVIEEKENPLMKRKELVISIDFDGSATPSKAQLQAVLAKDLNANVENLEITRLLSDTGLSKGRAWIKVWKEKKIPLYTEKKKAGEQTAQAEAKPEGEK